MEINNMLSFFVSQEFKFFFLLTPFFGLSMFITMTSSYPAKARRLLAIRVALSASIIGLVLFFFGRMIFDLFGITVDAFRIGTGVLLMLTAIALMNPKVKESEGTQDDISVVPLAMPIFIGPATSGALVVLSADVTGFAARATVALSWVSACFSVGVLLLGAAWLEYHLGRRGLGILMRLTALVLAALSAQMIMTGVQAFLGK